MQAVHGRPPTRPSAHPVPSTHAATFHSQLLPDSWEALRDKLMRVLVSSSRSSKPSIFGMEPQKDASATTAAVASEAGESALQRAP